ncbi:MAG: photosystem I reaction center subunit PsaK [Fischerella sp.]|uniref:photosystem I reaction center subunit PsaK n=1 Tax=Fischerella sp. TaxID=1191 RepID=UPI0017A2C429|nr:photosystem I reaction center subunit PsaK [Fischerella sp.]NWF60643.1 photosystem I reaction center subunit PsaK [Fischerella sp.]
MLTSTLLAAATTPLQWSPAVGVTMILCNILAILFGRYTIKYPNAEPALPPNPVLGNFGVPALLACAAFGHILGAGVILGLHNLGRF